MSYTPQPNDVLLLSTWAQMEAQAAVITQHWLVNSIGAGGLTQAELAAHQDTFMSGTIKAIMSQQWDYRGTTCQKIWPLPLVPFEADTSHQGAGAIAQNAMPPQLATVISFQLATTYRGGKPRMYIYGAPVTALTADGRYSAAWVLALTTLAPFLFGTYTATVGGRTTNYSVVNYTKRTHATQLITGFRPISTATATQRRRSYYGRANTAPI